MDDKSHIIEKISLLLFLAASLLALAGFLPIRLRMFSNIAEGVLRDAGADDVSVGAVSVVPWRGVSVWDVEAHKRIGDSAEYVAEISRIDIRCNGALAAVALLANPRLFKPERDLFREAYEKPVVFAGEAALFAESFGPLGRAELRGVNVRVRTREKRGGDRGRRRAARGVSDTSAVKEAFVSGVSISGASAALRARGGGGRRVLEGSVFAERTVVPRLAVVENFGVTMRAEAGRLLLTGGGGELFGGKVGAELAMGLGDMRIIGGGLRVTGLDLERFCAETEFTPGRLLGKVDIEITAEAGSSALLDSVKAAGVLSVSDLTAVDLALQRTPIVNQLSRDLRTLRFSRVDADLQLADARVVFNEMNAVGDVMRFKTSGWIDFESRMSYDMEGELGAEFVKTLPRAVRNALERTESGGGGFKCRITGTFHKPRITVDRSVYRRGARNLFR